ncbi:MAG: long-chain fatty acid--CoA ligase [Spirochaetaceae bacterium]|nr:MAG: long-chain fatty acid--CoA ligase [Spirochaetaceae bacterium]
MKHNPKPWEVLDELRGKVFSGEWPTLPELFYITKYHYPNRRCFSILSPEEMSFTYSEAFDRIRIFSNYLASLGLKKGDKVALTGKNSPQWALTYFSILFAGGIVVPLDYMLSPLELHGLIKASDTVMLIVDEEKYDLIDPENTLGLVKIFSLSKNKPGYVLDIAFDKEIPHEMPAENDIAAILFTSGTTGVAKGVMLTHKNFASDCFSAQGNMNLFPTDVFYALLPLHHSYAMLAVMIEALSVGAEVLFSQKIVTAQMMKDLKQGHVTMFLGIPMLFNKVIKALMKGIREKGIIIYGVVRFLMSLSGLIKKIFKVNPGKKLFHGILSKISLDNNRICICGGGPLPTKTFKLFNQLGIDFVQGYGLTETSPILTLNPIFHYKEKSVGKCIPHAELRIDSPDKNGNGEIVARGPMIMKGYYKKEKETTEAFTADGWFRTGDAGHIDHENYVYLTGRKKNLIVTEGGKNVYPEEIEDKFQLYDEIEQILVKSYLVDKKSKSEHIEALIFPAREWAQNKALPIIKSAMDDIVAAVNKTLLPYQRIERTRVLDKPMETGGTLKIKRHKVE